MAYLSVDSNPAVVFVVVLLHLPQVDLAPVRGRLKTVTFREQTENSQIMLRNFTERSQTIFREYSERSQKTFRE